MPEVTVDRYIRTEDCPFRNVLDKIGDKWSFLDREAYKRD
jgi:DNA-binding HxlR family transcriptional regulator